MMGYVDNSVFIGVAGLLGFVLCYFLLIPKADFQSNQQSVGMRVSAVIIGALLMVGLIVMLGFTSIIVYCGGGGAQMRQLANYFMAGLGFFQLLLALPIKRALTRMGQPYLAAGVSVVAALFFLLWQGAQLIGLFV